MRKRDAWNNFRSRSIHQFISSVARNQHISESVALVKKSSFVHHRRLDDEYFYQVGKNAVACIGDMRRKDVIFTIGPR